MEFYFDFISPYAYVELPVYAEYAEKEGVPLRLVPVVFAALLNQFSRKGPAEIPALRKYAFSDVARWAALRKLPMKYACGHPFKPILPLRVVVALQKEGREKEALSASLAIFKAIWGESRPAWEIQCLSEVLAEVGLEEDWEEKTQQIEVKEALIHNGKEAVEREIFGVPTIRVKGENIWGAGRLGFVKDIWNDRDPLSAYNMDEILSRPRLADRK